MSDLQIKIKEMKELVSQLENVKSNLIAEILQIWLIATLIVVFIASITQQNIIATGLLPFTLLILWCYPYLKTILSTQKLLSKNYEFLNNVK